MVEEKLTNEEIFQRFEEACRKLERYSELYDDVGFCPSSSAQAELDEFQKEYDSPEKITKLNEELGELGSHEEELAELKDRVFYNDVADNADQIYGDVLKYAKMIAADFAEFGLDEEEFLERVYGAGIFKGDIDDEKEFDEEIAEESIYPKTEKVEPIVDDDELEEYLFGRK